MKKYFLFIFFSFIGLLFVSETLAQPREALLQTPASKLDRLAQRGQMVVVMLSDFNPHVGINNCFYLQTSNRLNGVARMPAAYQFEFADPNALVLGVGIAKGKTLGFALVAAHSSILNDLFPNLSNTAATDAPDLPRASEQLGDQIISYLAFFMRGNPLQASGQYEWPRYDGTQSLPVSNKVIFFTPNNIHMHQAYGANETASKAGHQCAFWNELYPD